MKKNNVPLTGEEKKNKRKFIGMLAGLIGLGAAAATGIGLTIHYAVDPAYKSYTVTIKNCEQATIHGGTSQRVLHGTQIGQLPIPFESWRVFDKWVDAENKEIDINMAITSNMEVYATWKEPTLDAFTVTFNLDGGEIQGITGTQIKVNNRTLIGKLPSPIKYGFVFDIWTDEDGQDLPFDTPITRNITITAKYKETTGATISGGSRLLEFKSDETGTDTNQWVLSKGGKAVTDVDWSIQGKEKKSGEEIKNLTISSDGRISWDKVTAGSYNVTVTGSERILGGISASAEIAVVVEDPVYALSGGTTLCSAKFAEGGHADKPWALTKDGTTITSGITWLVTKADGTTPQSISTITAPNGILTWTTATPNDNYDLRIHATFGGKDVAQVAVGLIIAENKYELKDGENLIKRACGTSYTATAWNLYKDGTTQITTEITWQVVNANGGSLPQGVSISDSGQLKLDGTMPTPVGEYNLRVQAKLGGTYAAAINVGLVITDNVYELRNGSTQQSELFGKGGTGTAWELYKDGNKFTETETEKITWSITGTTETSINITGGVLSWTAATPVGNYDLKVTAKVGNDIPASVNVSLVITENKYVLAGGSRGFTVKPSDTTTDANDWTLTKDSSAYTGHTLSIDDITPALTSGSITIENNKNVKLTKIPEGSYTFNVTATDGNVKIKEQVSVISTETYSIQYGDGTKGSSLTIKDSDAATDSNEFTLLDSGTTTLTAATWELTNLPAALSGKLAFDQTGNKNKLRYNSVPTGTYNLTITAKIDGVAKAVIPFTLISQDTKISLVITGADTIKTGDGLTSTYDTNLTDKSRVSWTIDSWVPTVAGATPPTTTIATGVCTVTVVNQLHPEGILTLKATDSTSGQTATKTITITKPYTESSKVFTYDTTNQWCTVPMTDLAGTGTITKTTLGGTALTAIARTAFNDAVYIGDKVVMISDNFLDGCTTFNSEITFDTASECAVIGNDFLSGCTAFNQTFTIPASVQMIGDSFFNNCKAFNKAITIPATVTKVGNDFMYNCYAMVSTITIDASAMIFEATGATPLTLACGDFSQACYQTGITIAGTGAAEFKLLFPNITATTTGVVCRNLK